MSDSPPRPWLAWVLGIFPLALFASAGIALWLNFRGAKKAEAIEQERFAQQVSEPLMTDDLKKIVEVIGERNASSDSGKQGLSRMASMIEGLLGPSNTGYPVTRTLGPQEWPLLSITIHGKKPDAAPLWIITSYDSRVGSPGVEANASGLAATLATAQALARDKPEHAIHFVFLPHANDPASPVQETSAKLQKFMAEFPKPAAILCVEAMGAGDKLWIYSADPTAKPLERVKDLGTIHTAETIYNSERPDMTRIFNKQGLPAVRVATRAAVSPEEADARMPSTGNLAAATGRLIELVRRCSK